MKFIIKSSPQLLFLIFGGVVVLMSLMSANRIFSQGSGLELTKQKLYFQGEILPDHLLYPTFAGLDRLQIIMANNSNKVDLKTECAWKRLAYTQALLEKGHLELSFSTLTKAYKYYLDALITAQSLSLTTLQKERLIESVEIFQFTANDLFTSFSDSQQEELNRLGNQLTVLSQFFIDSI
ncbi:MAG: hypothetical protein A2383_00880 [Candidatus Pacebacteria bacterium RIFOXYB1_FULL_39_46]|nr:MAG: hypothetical protein A2182_00715 [Candidatus Pacebacteria bacterium RIFOXYA1_FULL_38_18]OGJ38137.1 MAG: hypothetical protein A2383_00880 [Candidatus Pacebacteria bacterium RIFOXYB1_FULL_39_46]OGJ39641.1 MAG: hypothetical protein A2411_02560 [Candidatus Pacebacteria bacterium RIFOXYC1_FULL_39_21]OGJ39889.1 MAG: hypothetical protein A2582_00645 [Candidatus Pacebacteria bacterium RIFOXYD1_FULL_39_27]